MIIMPWKSERRSSFAARARNKVNRRENRDFGGNGAEILKFKSETMMRKTLLCERVSRKRELKRLFAVAYVVVLPDDASRLLLFLLQTR